MWEIYWIFLNWYKFLIMNKPSYLIRSGPIDQVEGGGGHDKGVCLLTCPGCCWQVLSYKVIDQKDIRDSPR